MKVTKLILMLILGGFAAIPSWAQNKSSQDEIKKIAESKEYTIDVNIALPMRGRNIPLTSHYSLEIKKDSVISQLPYFGRGYKREHQQGRDGSAKEESGGDGIRQTNYGVPRVGSCDRCVSIG